MDQFISSKIGVDDDELLQFEKRTDEVAKLIQGLKDGSINPTEVRIPGEKTEEEKRVEEVKEVEKEKARRDLELRLASKESNGWWEKAEIFRGMTRKEASEHAQNLRNQSKTASSSNQTENVTEIRDDDGNVLFPKPKVKPADLLDYSHWDRWVPDDPVSLEEMAKVKAKHDKAQLLEFEKNNPDFCNQYKEDQIQREKVQERKQESSISLKARGNKQFKLKSFHEALRLYHEALKVTPFETALLTNIAQTHSRLVKDCKSKIIRNVRIESENSPVKLPQDLVRWEVDHHLSLQHEFCERALFLDWYNTKALWRKASLSMDDADYESAVEYLSRIKSTESMNDELGRMLKEAKESLAEQRAKESIKTKLSKAEERKKSLKAALEGGNEGEFAIDEVVKSFMANPPSTLELVNQVSVHLKELGELHGTTKQEDWKLNMHLILSTLCNELKADDIESHVLLRTSGVLHTLFGWTVMKRCPEGLWDGHQSSSWKKVVNAAWQLQRVAVENNQTGQALLKFDSHATVHELQTMSVDLTQFSEFHQNCLVLVASVCETPECQKLVFSDQEQDFNNWVQLLEILESACSLTESAKNVHATKASSAAIEILFNLANNGGAQQIRKVLGEKDKLPNLVSALFTLIMKKDIPNDDLGNLFGCIASLACDSVVLKHFETGSDFREVVKCLTGSLHGNGVATKNLALAALLNLSATSKQRVVEDVIAASRPTLQLLFDSFTNKQAHGVSTPEVSTRGENVSRAAALFARCFPSKEVVEFVCTDAQRLGAITRTMSSSFALRASNPQALEVLQHAVRVVGSAAQIQAAKADSNKDALAFMYGLLSSGVAQVVCDILRVSAQESESGKDRFGIKSKKKLLVGNSAQFLISLLRVENADFKVVVATLLEKMNMVKVIITLLSSCADGPVRKNSAIVLAKLARDPRFTETVKKNRGTQILIELGRRIV